MAFSNAESQDQKVKGETELSSSEKLLTPVGEARAKRRTRGQGERETDNTSQKTATKRGIEEREVKESPQK